MLVALDQIRPGTNVRTIPITETERQAMKESMAVQGMLTPMLCRPVGLDHHLEVVLGFQRYQAAQELGIIQVEIEVREMTDAEVAEAQLAENIVRAAMHPVDIWRQVRELHERGRPFADIAHSLGQTERDIRRWERLGCLAPEMLALAEIQMPSDSELRTIAAASPKVQKQVAKARDIKAPTETRLVILWDVIAQRCKVDRIYQSKAIFNTGTAKIDWEEDLFALDGAEDQWFTTEVEKFRKAQYEAIRQRCADLGKRKIEARPLALENGRLTAPTGFMQIYSFNLEKPKKHEVQFHGMRPDGSVEILVALDLKAQRAEETKAAEKRKKKTQAARGEDPVPLESVSERAGRGPISQEGLNELAAMRTEAVQRALAEPMGIAQVLQTLLVALACENVTVAREGYGRERFDDIAKLMVEPGGNFLPVNEATLIESAKEALGKIIKFAGPKASGQWASGPWGEIVGKAVNANDHLPRFDTAEFLSRLSGEELRTLHADYMAANPSMVSAGKKTAAALRESLVGRLPDWRPLAAQFGAKAA